MNIHFTKHPTSTTVFTCSRIRYKPQSRLPLRCHYPWSVDSYFLLILTLFLLILCQCQCDPQSPRHLGPEMENSILNIHLEEKKKNRLGWLVYLFSKLFICLQLLLKKWNGLLKSNIISNYVDAYCCYFAAASINGITNSLVQCIHAYCNLKNKSYLAVVGYWIACC